MAIFQQKTVAGFLRGPRRMSWKCSIALADPRFQSCICFPGLVFPKLWSSPPQRKPVSLCPIHSLIRGQFLAADSLACILFPLVGIQPLRVSL
jgi:hypothetical protein